MVNGHITESSYDRYPYLTCRPLLHCGMFRLKEHLSIPIPTKKVQELPSHRLLRNIDISMYVPVILVHFPGYSLLD